MLSSMLSIRQLRFNTELIHNLGKPFWTIIIIIIYCFIVLAFIIEGV